MNQQMAFCRVRLSCATATTPAHLHLKTMDQIKYYFVFGDCSAAHIAGNYRYLVKHKCKIYYCDKKLHAYHFCLICFQRLWSQEMLHWGLRLSFWIYMMAQCTTSKPQRQAALRTKQYRMVIGSALITLENQCKTNSDNGTEGLSLFSPYHPAPISYSQSMSCSVLQ